MCDITHQTPPLNNAPQCHSTMHHDGIQRRKHEHQEVRRRGRQCGHLWCAVFFNFNFIFILTYQVPPLFEQIQRERGGRVQPLPFCFHHHHLDVETRHHHHHSTTTSVRHGFVNPRGYPGMGKAGTGTGHLVVTHRKPTPVAQVWRVF